MNIPKLIKLSIFLTSMIIFNQTSAQDKKADDKYVMVIHGGAGTILKSQMSPEKEKAYKAALTLALETGYRRLKAGESSLNAVEAAVHVMENSPLFNAGKGAVFTNEGKNEMDAAIMEGHTLMAGSVAGVTTIKNRSQQHGQ